jgi:hypothetical protein
MQARQLLVDDAAQQGQGEGRVCVVVWQCISAFIGALLGVGVTCFCLHPSHHALVLTRGSFQHLLQLHRISHPFIPPPTRQWAFSIALQEVCVKSHVSPSMIIFNHARHILRRHNSLTNHLQAAFQSLHARTIAACAEHVSHPC